MTAKRLFLAGVLTFSLLTLGGDRAHADNPMCKPDKTVFENEGKAFPNLDIRKTGQNLVTTLAVDTPTKIIAGRNPSEMIECSYSALKNSGNHGLERRADRMVDPTGPCPSLNTTKDCRDFTIMYNAGLDREGINAYMSRRSWGSLLGIANTLDGARKTEPVPVNLAFYWNDVIKNVPFAKSALAANINYGALPAIMEPLLTLWKVFRNIAFGILATAMLVTGIMIMTRKKLSPQAVVTAQYALPRIALAVILIVFSYPIGAIMASSMHYLASIIESLVYNAVGSSQGLAVGTLIGILLLDLVVAFGVGNVVGLIVVLILCLVILILKLAIIIKAWLMMLRLIFSIVFSPIQFAISAVPGNEASMQTWFKKSVGYVVGYVAMFAMAAVVDAIIIEMAGAVSVSFVPGLGASILAVIFTPVFLIFGYIQALKVPSKVESFISGDPKKPSGRR